MQLWLMYGLCFGSAVLAGIASYPPMAERIAAYVRRRAAEATAQLSDMFLNLSHYAVWLMYTCSPLVVGGLAWLMTENWIFGCVGAAVGIAVPRLILVQMQRNRHKRFQAQLVDGLLLLSSSLKAGLSMLQAFTVLVEEMPPPISQEFGLVLKETRMGISLEEAMAHLKRRMPSDEVTLFITAVLVARETGGDITHIFARLVETLRERKKIKERIKTLTFMARLQGIIMAMLPLVFGYVVYRMNNEYFQFFFTDPLGRMMFGVVIGLQVIGLLLFARFSRAPM